MVTRFEKVLPALQWQMILKNVPPGSLCRVAMTSKYMNGLANWPKLWTDMRVNVRKVRDDGLVKFYSIDRFKRVTKIDFSNVEFTKEQLERLLNDMDGSPLENANFWDTDFREIPAEVLARAAGQLKTFKLSTSSGRRLTTDQCVKLLEAIVSSTTLVNLTLKNQTFYGVPAWMLSKVVCRLEAVNLCATELTTYQSIELLKSTLSSETLTKLNLRWVDLSKVPSDLISRVVSRLRAVDLGIGVFINHYMSTLQCAQILEAIPSSSKLVKLSLTGVDLSPVSAEVLANAVRGLQIVDLSYPSLTTGQCVALLEAALASKTIVKVYLSSVNLSEVPGELLVRTVRKMKTLDLRNTQLTSDQCVEVVDGLISSPTVCWTDLYGNQITDKVPAEKLASLPPHVFAEHNN